MYEKIDIYEINACMKTAECSAILCSGIQVSCTISGFLMVLNYSCIIKINYPRAREPRANIYFDKSAEWCDYLFAEFSMKSNASFDWFSKTKASFSWTIDWLHWFCVTGWCLPPRPLPTYADTINVVLRNWLWKNKTKTKTKKSGDKIVVTDQPTPAFERDQHLGWIWNKLAAPIKTGRHLNQPGQKNWWRKKEAICLPLTCDGNKCENEFADVRVPHVAAGRARMGNASADSDLVGAGALEPLEPIKTF